jgi:hypothetical protein
MLDTNGHESGIEREPRLHEDVTTRRLCVARDERGRKIALIFDDKGYTTSKARLGIKVMPMPALV